MCCMLPKGKRKMRGCFSWVPHLGWFYRETKVGGFRYVERRPCIRSFFFNPPILRVQCLLKLANTCDLLSPGRILDAAGDSGLLKLGIGNQNRYHVKTTSWTLQLDISTTFFVRSPILRGYPQVVQFAVLLKGHVCVTVLDNPFPKRTKTKQWKLSFWLPF